MTRTLTEASLVDESQTDPSLTIGRVVHRNDLFLKNGGTLTATQLRLFLFIVSQIPKKLDSELPAILVDEEVVANLIGYKGERRGWIGALRENLDGLAVAPAVVTDAEGGTVITSWFEYIRIAPDGKNFVFQLNPILTPFFMRLTEQFTIFEVGYVFSLESSHSIRLYDFLKGEAFKRSCYVDLDELRQRLGLVRYDVKGNIVEYKYSEYKRFKSKVIDPAISEINEKTDLDVQFAPVRGAGSKAVVGLTFSIQGKDILPAFVFDCQASGPVSKAVVVDKSSWFRDPAMDEPPSQLTLFH